MTVNEIRENDGKGRHTTTHRQLIMLKNGAMIIDTPGMRELGIPQYFEMSESEPVKPTKEEVLAMHERVLEGMSEEEIERLTENFRY